MYVQALSTASDTHAAATQAAREAAAGLRGARPTAVLVFSTDNHDSERVLAAVRAVFGNVPTTGCNAPGVLACGRVTHDGVAVLASDTLRLAAVAVDGIAVDSEAVMARAVDAALDAFEAVGGEGDGPSSLLLMLPDGIAGNSVRAARGAVGVVGSSLRLAGGGSGDDMKFVGSRQYCDAAVHERSALAAVLGASSPIGVALRHGCHPIGPPMIVTEVHGARLGKLDFVPAFERYRDLARDFGLGEVEPEQFVAFAMLHPLGILQGVGGDHVLRSPLAVAEDGSIACCSEVPPNAAVRFMIGTPETLLAAAREAASAARADLGSAAPGAALVFACVSRDAVLGADELGISRELAAVRDGLGCDVPMFGCLTFGAFGTLGAGLPQYHSKSIDVAVLPAS